MTSAATGKRIPPWVWAVIVALSSIPPLTHFWIAHFPPEGTVPTGLHGGDSAVFIHCMRMFDTDFFSPYANRNAERGAHSPTYFAAPFFWMYGVVGATGRALHIGEFQMLGVVNGLGGFAYLLAAYLFLRAVFPKRADSAFLIFALGGGPGGILYIVAAVFGMHGAANFEPYFLRYATYQLIEGASLLPVLIMTRLYYTVPLACLLGAIALLVTGRGKPSRRLIAMPLLFAGTFINLRFGPMAWGVFVLYLMADTERPVAGRMRLGALAAMPVLLAWAFGALMLRNNPAYVGGAVSTVRTNIWLSPFIAATIFHLAVVPGQALRAARGLPCFARTCAYAGIGYMAAYVLLYCLYNAYYGNVWHCLDFTSAVRISDWALLGALPGALLANIGADRKPGPPLDGWIALWLIAYTAVGISAFGQGWFLRLVPQRLLVLLALPFAIAVAEGLHRLRWAHPRAATGLTWAIVSCGVCSIAVASACFQGPLGHWPGCGPFAVTHCELATKADARLLDLAEGGVVLTPVTWGPAMGDVAAARPGTSTVFGYGSLNLLDRQYPDTFEALDTFFTEGMPAASRKKLVDDWSVDYVLCPDCHPVDENVIEQLRHTPWLSEVVQSGKGVLFSVDEASRETPHD